MSKLGRPAGISRKSNITRSFNIPKEIYNKCVWLADRWTREDLSEDGTKSPEYWTVGKVIATVMTEYLDHLSALDPSLVSYFENCALRDSKARSISKGINSSKLFATEKLD